LFRLQVELPELGRNGVLIQVKACGLSISGVEPTTLSHILSKGTKNLSVGAGHDIAGIVVETGEEVTALSRGDHVVGKKGLGTFEVLLATGVKIVAVCVAT
jgi:NADPH:quinone reductase-like Zn-dependent oxidoreductase